MLIVGSFIGGHILVYISNYNYQRSIELTEEEENAARASHTKVQLSNTLKNIELFNIIYGHYPDDIRQIEPLTFLRNIDPYAPRDICIYEFYYYYHSNQDKYVLISMGPDQTLFTADDVYPVTPTSEASTLALLNEPIQGFNYPTQECLPF